MSAAPPAVLAAACLALGCGTASPSSEPDDAAIDAAREGATDAPTDGARDGSIDAGDDARADGPVWNTPDAGGCSPESGWAPLSVLTVEDPLAHGATGDGLADDLGALTDTIAALPASGGVVWIAPGKSFRKSDLLTITKPHVKLWSVNRGGEIYATVGGVVRKQSILCKAPGCGLFGLKLRSDATARFDALEDNQISVDHTTDAEIVGVEIDGSAAAGVFLYGSVRTYVEGNFIHHTWSDHIHHTDAARASWCWDNWIFNEPPSKGDDGIACVTYGETSPRCGDMEWWHDTILQTGWGRGYSVIGGEDIAIHDNWAIRVAGAGVIVASESSYKSASSTRITARGNHLYQCAQAIGHPGILVSGGNPSAAPLSDLAFVDNVVAETATGTAYAEEGAFTAVTNTGMSTKTSDLPTPLPTRADVRLRDTTVLATRDVSFVAPALRNGLHRIHVRKVAGGYQQRFEYVVRGTPAAMSAFLAEPSPGSDCLAEMRVVDGTAYALVLTAQPIAVPASLDGPTFRELRAGDLDGSLGWLWKRLNERSYAP
ncbi:MAG: hypothetical protein NVSMB47_11430 [Polyangiales bacterium]